MNALAVELPSESEYGCQSYVTQHDSWETGGTMAAIEAATTTRPNSSGSHVTFPPATRALQNIPRYEIYQSHDSVRVVT
jgi:hypothetical protein